MKKLIPLILASLFANFVKGQTATTNKVTLNINNFNSGIYFVNLYTGKALVKTEKLIIIK